MSDIKTYCEKYADTIFVRAYINGKWGSYPFSQLSDKDKEYWIKLWSEKEDFLPHRTI